MSSSTKTGVWLMNKVKREHRHQYKIRTKANLKASMWAWLN